MALHIVQQQPNPWVQMGVNLLGGLITDAINRGRETTRNRKENLARQAIDEGIARNAPTTTNYMGGLVDTPEGYNDNPWAAAAHKQYTPLTQFDMGSADFLPQSVNQPQQQAYVPSILDVLKATNNVMANSRYSGLNRTEFDKNYNPTLQEYGKAYDQNRRQEAANAIMNAQNDTEKFNQILGGLVNGSVPEGILPQFMDMYKYNNPYAQPYLHNTGQETFYGGFNPKTGQFTQQGSYQNTMSPQEQAQNQYNYARLAQDDRHWTGDNQLKREELTQKGNQWQSDYELRKRQTDIDEAYKNRQQTFLEETTKWEQAFKERGVLTEQNETILKNYKQQFDVLDKQEANILEMIENSDDPDKAEKNLKPALIAIQQKRNQLLNELNVWEQTLTGVSQPQNTQPIIGGLIDVSTNPWEAASRQTYNPATQFDKGVVDIMSQPIAKQNTTQSNSPKMWEAPNGDSITEEKYNEMVQQVQSGQDKDYKTVEELDKALRAKGFVNKKQRVAITPEQDWRPSYQKVGSSPALTRPVEIPVELRSNQNTQTITPMQNTSYNMRNEPWYQQWNNGELPLTSATNSNQGIRIGNEALQYQNNQRVDVIPPYREEMNSNIRQIVGGEKVLSRGFNNYKGLVERTAVKYNVDPKLISAIIQAESAWNPNATSNAGARGLMQLMPKTAQGLGVRNSYDPAQNIEGGTKYIAQMLRMLNGNIRKALWAYNAGPGNAKKDRLPNETRAYITKVMDIYNRLKRNKG